MVSGNPNHGWKMPLRWQYGEADKTTAVKPKVPTGWHAGSSILRFTNLDGVIQEETHASQKCRSEENAKGYPTGPCTELIQR